MGLQIALVAEEMMRRMKEGKTGDLQVGIDLSELMKQREEQQKEMEKVFGIPADQVHTFLSMLSKKGDEIIMRSHAAARDAMKKVQPHLKVGATFSLYDLQPEPDGEEKAKELWEQDFGHYLPYLMDDDFIGVQNYTRKRVSANGSLPEPEGAELTDMGYEFYPWAVSHVAEKVYEQTKKPVLITENGIATADDTRRCAYINEALEGVAQCIENQVPVLGYLHWSLLDNFEWQKGFCMKFGLIAVDRTTQKRCPKPSLYELGKWR